MSADLHTAVARVYDPPSSTLGQRVLVDRLWPRGVRSHTDRFDVWLKGVAPTTELRRWYGHRPERFAEFSKRYRDELTGGPSLPHLLELEELARAGPITLVTATRDLSLSAAMILAAVLDQRLGRSNTLPST